jgi:hypothetical protein
MKPFTKKIDFSLLLVLNTCHQIPTTTEYNYQIQLHIVIMSTTLDNETEIIYQKYENMWYPLTKTMDKKQLSHITLRLCKNMRDRFDDYETDDEFTNEPISILDLDDFINIEKYQEKWYTRTDIWRTRFNEAHS